MVIAVLALFLLNDVYVVAFRGQRLLTAVLRQQVLVQQQQLHLNHRPGASLHLLRLKLDDDDEGAMDEYSSRRRAVKTGSHSYASWKSAKDTRNNLWDDDETATVKREDFDFVDDDDNYSSSGESPPPSGEETSPIIQWLRRVYDAIFFYGLDPAPKAVQRSNKRKIMQDSDTTRDSDKPKKSPFFTATEQRVQEYMASARPKDVNPAVKGQSIATVARSGVSSSSSSGSSSGKSRKGLDEQQRRSRLADLSEELELVEAEMLTTAPESPEYGLLLARRNQFLDLIDELEQGSI